MHREYFRIDYFDGLRAFVRGGPEDEYATLEEAEKVLTANRAQDDKEYRLMKVTEEPLYR